MKNAVSLIRLPSDFENNIFKKYSVRKLAIFSTYIFLLVLCIGTLFLLVSLMFRRCTPVIGFSIGIVLIMYFIKSITEVAAGFSTAAGYIGTISPFSWIDTDINSVNNNFEWQRLLFLEGVSAIAVILSTFQLKFKDILL